jgi:hypothetical protein
VPHRALEDHDKSLLTQGFSHTSAEKNELIIYMYYEQMGYLILDHSVFLSFHSHDSLLV